MDLRIPRNLCDQRIRVIFKSVDADVGVWPLFQFMLLINLIRRHQHLRRMIFLLVTAALKTSNGIKDATKLS